MSAAADGTHVTPTVPYLDSDCPFYHTNDTNLKDYVIPAVASGLPPQQTFGHRSDPRLDDVGQHMVPLVEVCQTLPVGVSRQHQVRPSMSVHVNNARSKWGCVSFYDREAVEFRHRLTHDILDLRRQFARCNSKVTLPQRVHDEALKYAASRFGPGWEMFDATKHIDIDEADRIEAKKKQALALSRTRLVEQQQQELGLSSTVSPGGAGPPERPLWSFDEVDTKGIAPPSADRSLGRQKGMAQRVTLANLEALVPYFTSGINEMDYHAAGENEGIPIAALLDRVSNIH